MASTKIKAWGPTHPSSAFLIKCAKEKEKLKSTLQGQLQEHMLQMLQNNVFSDTLIGVNANLKEPGENKNKHPDLPRLFNAHKAILKVRTPAFYNHLNEHEEANLGVTSYNAYLQESELLQFLNKVYTDDDIRKHECEALHLSKKYIERVRHNKGPVNKHIFEVDEFEKESVNSSCTESFVTPKTSPISPESKADVVGIFGAASNQANMRKNKINNVTTCPSQAYKAKSSVVNELHIDLSLDKDTPEVLDSDVKSPGIIQNYQNSNGKNSRMSSDDSHSSTTNPEGTNSDSELGEVSNLGSMVRSNTFDLETQGSLEDAAIDDSIEWCYRGSASDDRSKNADPDIDKLKPPVPSKRNEGTGFYLHDHTPSPKSNLFKNPFQKESSFSSSHDLESASSGLHVRRIDGSMSDSGFLSHSTFSLLSDNGISNSVASSLIMSSDGIVSVEPEMNPPLSESGKTLSGSMFPFYIDINSLPPPSPNSAKSKKSSPSHTYMYIDARNHKVSIGPNPKAASQNTTYDEFFAGLESKDRYVMKEPLTKAQSTSQLDRCSDNSKLNFAKDRHRPQSCYMYVDLESLKHEPVQSRKSSINEPSSVSMFIDLKDDPKECNETSEEIYSRMSSGSHQSSILSGNSDQHSNEKFAGEQKRKMSDSLISTSPSAFEARTKFFSLERHQESRSVTSLDNHPSNHHEVFHLFHSTGPRKSRSAHRYSDGVYYDNLYHRKISNDNLCQLADTSVSKDSKAYQSKDMKPFDQTYRLMQCFSKNEEASGSCSSLGKMGLPDRLLSDEKIRWKSTGEIEEPRGINRQEESGLLPMSPILRRKKQVKETTEVTPPVVIKASTKPQDVDAMKFPKSLVEKTETPDKPLSESSKIEEYPVQSSNSKTLEKQDSKSSSDSLKLVSERPPEGNGIKIKTAESMSRSGSSLVSGAESSSDKHINHDIKEKMLHSPFFMSGSCEFEDDTETIYSEVSDVSSSLGGVSGVASLERRWRESQNQQSEYTDKNSRNTRHMLEACSKLGEDLLKMFLDEIDTDITIEVEGKQIRAHRCILASRGKYFANLLRTNNPEKNTSTISLEGFTYSAVHFALCHIYSGAMSIPKDCNISELALLADMLNLDTLTHVIVFHLKMHYCHFFHRPCLQCSQGVVECLPLAVVCGLNELRDKCIYWLGRNFTRTWTNKAFAALSEELRDLCFNVTVNILAINTVIDMTLNCDRLLTTLPQLKWTEPIFGMITKLLQKCIHYMAKHFDEILNSEGFLALGKGQSWNVTALEEDIISSIELMAPDVACKSYDSVNRLILVAESMESTGYGEFTQNFIDLLHKISRHSERYLIQNANKVVHCENWACLSPQFQKRIKDAAVIVFEFEKPTAPPPRLSSLHRKLKKQNESEEISLERSTYPKKGRAVHSRKYQRDFSPKSVNSQCSQDSPERSVQRRDHESLIKKMVSPIKEEAQYSSVDTSTRDVSYDRDAVLLYGSPARSHLSNRAYIDAHEEDSLRDLQDLPQDHTNQGEPGSESQMLCSVASLDLDESRSPAHCSDNPDSLEISSDSKEDVDLSASAEDGSNPEKGVIEKPEVLDKTFDFSSSSHSKESSNNKTSSQVITSTPKPSLSIPVRDKAPSLLPTVKDGPGKIREKSPIKKSHQGKSLLPLAKSHEVKVPISPDLVAEIDADSRMVSHCLQEAEMLEQQLSRKLQRQHLDTPIRTRAEPHGTRLQKASSTSQIKSLANGTARGRSPGRSAKSNASSPSVGHPPRIFKCGEARMARKASQSPKNSVPPSGGPFRSVESIHKQVSVVSQTPKRVVTRSSSRTKVIAVSSVRTAVGPK